MVLLLPIGNELYGYSQQPHDYLHNIELRLWIRWLSRDSFRRLSKDEFGPWNELCGERIKDAHGHRILLAGKLRPERSCSQCGSFVTFERTQIVTGDLSLPRTKSVHCVQRCHGATLFFRLSLLYAAVIGHFLKLPSEPNGRRTSSVLCSQPRRVVYVAFIDPLFSCLYTFELLYAEPECAEVDEAYIRRRVVRNLEERKGCHLCSRNWKSPSHNRHTLDALDNNANLGWDAMQEELLQFKIQKVYDSCNLPYGKKANWNKNGFIEIRRMERSVISDEFLEELTFFLGLQVKQKEDDIFISQDKSNDWFFNVLTASRPDYYVCSLCCSRVSSSLPGSLLCLVIMLEHILDRKSTRQEVPASIRSDLLFDDAAGIDSLPNQAIFDAIQLMGYEGDLTLVNVQVPLDHFLVNALTSKVFSFMVKSRPTPSPPHPSEATVEPLSDPSPRPSPSTYIPYSIPESSDGNQGDLSKGNSTIEGEPSVHKDKLFDEIPEDTLDYMETEDAQDLGEDKRCK
ncbi:hypothetical protein Tco_1383112 [Tanacetum coccineum]